MSSNDLSLIIDPGGESGVREGINLRVYPSGEIPLASTGTSFALQRTANSSLLANTTRPIINFRTQFALSQSDFKKLKALYDYKINASSTLNPFEIVIYNLIEPFSELSTARTRYRVPGTVNISEVPTLYQTEFTYWIALQGAFNMTWEQKGALFIVDFTFEEGTKLTSAMEP